MIGVVGGKVVNSKAIELLELAVSSTKKRTKKEATPKTKVTQKKKAQTERGGKSWKRKKNSVKQANPQT